eukprot:s2311_g17.t1
MGSFRELLGRLEEAHDQELSQLREELRHTRWASRKQTLTVNGLPDFFDVKEALQVEDGSKANASPGEDPQEELPMGTKSSNVNLMMGTKSSNVNLMRKAKLQIFPEWEETGKEQGPANLIFARMSSLEQVETRHYLDIPLGGCCYSNFVFRPEVPFIIIWQLLGVLVLGFDTLWVPMEVFPHDPSAFFSWIQGLTSLYWFLDIFVTVNTGIYNEKGDIDMRRWSIFWSYASW